MGEPPKAVQDSRDLSQFLGRLVGSPRWGVQVEGTQNSREGFSVVRIRIQDPETNRWEVRELRAEVHEGVPGIAYRATEHETEEGAVSPEDG